jgi:hypothetical protein
MEERRALEISSSVADELVKVPIKKRGRSSERLPQIHLSLGQAGFCHKYS